MGLPPLIKLIHRDVDAGQDKTLDDFYGRIDGELQDVLFLGGKSSEHIVYLPTLWIIVANAHAQSGIVLTD